GRYQVTRTFLEGVAVLPQTISLDQCLAAVRVYEGSPHVMKGPEAFRRLNLDGLDIPILGKAGIHDYVLPGIGRLCRNREVLWHLHDKVRRADAPFVRSEEHTSE